MGSNNGNEISYFIEEIHNSDTDSDGIQVLDYQALIDEIDSIEIDLPSNDTDLLVPHMVNYRENYTVKELLIICEYYGFAKDVKSNKFTKDEIIHFLVNFETDPLNIDVVVKRQNLWFYINELKNDSFMKKYVLWN